MRLLAALATFVIFTAGCTVPGAAPEYTLEASIPDRVFIGQALEFTVNVSGEAWPTDHVGAHWWTSSQSEPTGALSTAACDHTAGDLPGSFDVLCLLEAPGTIYVRGHARIDVDGQTHDYWTSEHMVHVVPDENQWQLNAEGLPREVASGQEFTFTLVIDGEPEVHSEHIGGHWWAAGDAAENDLSLSAGGCAHTAGATQGTYHVTCTMDQPGEFELIGHLRISVGEENFEYWSAAHPVTVS